MLVKAKIKPVIKPEFQYRCPCCNAVVGGSFLLSSCRFTSGFTSIEIERKFICPSCWIGSDTVVWCENRIWEKR